MATPRVRHKKRDLIFLVYAPNTAYTILQKEVPEGVEVNTRKGTWTFARQTFLIGKGCLGFRARGGIPIGVYDRTLSHLQQMKSDSDYLARGPGRSMD